MNMIDYKKLDELINKYQEVKEPSVDEPTYTYVGEHYEPNNNDNEYNKQFTSTEFAVNVTEAISYAARDGLDNKAIAEVLSKILEEVRSR